MESSQNLYHLNRVRQVSLTFAELDIRLYITTVYLDIISMLSWTFWREGCLPNTLNTSVILSFAIHVFHAFFFQMESKYETWSHPVKPWKTKVLKLYPDQANNEYCELHIVFCFFPVPKSVQRWSVQRQWKVDTANTTTSVSTVLILTFFPCLLAMLKI